MAEPTPEELARVLETYEGRGGVTGKKSVEVGPMTSRYAKGKLGRTNTVAEDAAYQKSLEDQLRLQRQK